MVDYVKLAATAERLIEANGRSVTVTQQGQTPTDPTKPWRGQSTPVRDSVVGIAVVVDPATMGYEVQNVDNVKRADMLVLFAANNDGGKSLENFDTITDGSIVWKILRTQVLKPGATRLLYIFEVAR